MEKQKYNKEEERMPPRLFFFDTCMRHIYEIQRWSAEQKGAKKDVKK